MLNQFGIPFRSYWIYDYACKSIVKSDERKRYGRLDGETHQVMNKDGEIYGVIASDSQIQQIESLGWKVINNS